jgi:hypothetical protein
MALAPGGTTFLIEQHDHPDPMSADAGLQTWIDAMNSMKAHAESMAGPGQPQSAVPTVNVWEAARQAASNNLPTNESLLDSRGSRSGLYVLKTKEMAHPVDTMPAAGSGPAVTAVSSAPPGADPTIRVQPQFPFCVTTP